MKRFWPLLVLGLGCLLLVGSLVYDVLFAGIPYQDPTPEMSARYTFHSRIAATGYAVGGSGFVVGAVAGMARWVRRGVARRPVP